MADVLLIKLGYVEELPDTVSNLTSLSDVFSASVLLRHFEHDNVTVVTHREAAGLFKGIPCVSRVLSYDYQVSVALARERFDVVVNLEPAWEFCALADSILAERRFGFKLDDYGDQVVPIEGAEELLIFSRCPSKLRDLDRPFHELYYEAVGSTWTGQEYVVGMKPSVVEEFDLGFNVQCDRGSLNRNWSEMRWRELESLCSDFSISYSFQEYGYSIEDYVNWIASCRVLVTPDSLGLHLALALGKRVVALLGPTSPRVLHMYGRGEIVLPRGEFPCRPCYENECRRKSGCLESIESAEVLLAVTRQVQVASSLHKDK